MVSRFVGKNELNDLFLMQCSGSQLIATCLEHNPGRCECECCRAFEKVFRVLYHTGTSEALRAAGA